MKISCPNPSCGQHISGPKTLIGRLIACPACGQSFIGSDCFHSGDSFVIYDLETTGLYPDSDEFIQIAAVRYQSGCVRPDDGFFSYGRHLVQTTCSQPQLIRRRFIGWARLELDLPVAC